MEPRPPWAALPPPHPAEPGPWSPLTRRCPVEALPLRSILGKRTVWGAVARTGRRKDKRRAAVREALLQGA